MIHAICSNSNHLQSRQKADIDKRLKKSMLAEHSHPPDTFCLQTHFRLSAVEVDANFKDFWSYWAGTSVSVVFAGRGWGCGSCEGWQHWAYFAMFPATSLVFCRRQRELWAELALLLYFLSYSCWERLEPKQLLAPLQLTLLQTFL